MNVFFLGKDCGSRLQNCCPSQTTDRCTLSGCFVCAEEMRAYLTIVGTLREQLTPEFKVRFDQTESCQPTLECPTVRGSP